ncbi:hypothetical protein LOC68_01415 [Blastopirellula sp. JC732]|uniref:HEAT repeat domain-containing protein n=1 Tax=Blastopirellula sediminis TaxID=2894196 RepID=A0A9X1MHA0_9BACT|nr:hypothetical protein [Blastopirellula sediminis]MCC9627053.1 hypothetical protein [Blastopirellula sediminis]
MMTYLRHLALAIALALPAASIVLAEEAKTVEELIVDLGSDDFQTRKRAAEVLLERGMAAHPALVTASVSPDPTVKMQAVNLLDEIVAKDRRERIAAFRAAEKDVSLPCWEQFREVTGDDAVARRIFARMAESEWELFDLASNHPEEIDYAVYRRALEMRMRLYNTQSPPSMASVASLLLLTGSNEFDVTGPAFAELQYSLSSRPITQALNNPEEADVVRKLFNHWITHSVDSPYLSMQHRFSVLLLAIREDLQAGVLLARAIVEDPSPSSIQAIQNNLHMAYSILAIAKLGSTEDIPFLEKLFENDSDIVPVNQREPFESQVRDIALAAAIHLSGRNPREFGFDRITADANYLFSYRTVGFASDVERSAAFEKWHKVSPALSGG